MDDHDLKEPIDTIVKRFTSVLERADSLEEANYRLSEELFAAESQARRTDCLIEKICDCERGLISFEELVEATKECR